MRKPKTNSLYYFNKFIPQKLSIYNNKVLVNMQISSGNWSIPRKKVAHVCPYGIIRTNRKTLALQVNTPKATQCETGVASTAK